MSNILHTYVPKVKFNKIQGKPYVTVSAKGISNGLSDTYNDGADFGPDTLLNATSPNQYGPPYTQTYGIQEAINYIANLGGGIIFLGRGTFNITNTGQTSINIPFNIPIKILGEGKETTILKAPYGFFYLENSNSQNTNPIEIGQMTLQATQSSSSAGGYFVLASSTYGWSNIYIHDMDMYGGGNVDTGVFNIGSFNQVQGGAPLTNVLLKNLYLDTQGTTNGNEAYTFPMIYGDNFVLDNVTYKNTSGPGVGFFNVYGGVIVWKNSKIDSSGSSYINMAQYSTTPSLTNTNLFAKLILDNMIFENTMNTGGEGGFLPLDVIINNSVVKSAVIFSPSGANNVTLNSFTVSNTFVSEEYCSLGIGITASLIKLINVTIPDNNNQNSFAQPILTPNLPYTSMTVNIEVSNLYVGKPANQSIVMLFLPSNTSSIQAKYNIKWKGMSVGAQWVIGTPSSYTVYYDPNGFASLVNANPSYFLSVDFTHFDISNNILYRVTKNPNTPSTPSVPASGTAQVNTNSYPVEVYISGGSATQVQVTRNGTTYTVWSSSTATAIPPLTIRLNSGDSITLTYSTAPSWTWLPA